MKISVVVPAFNEESLIAETLGAIDAAAAALRERGWAVELIVCDNNSTDRTAELARGLGARVVFEPVNQIARARNRGASVASGQWLVFIDADSAPSPGLFADLAAEVAAGRCLAGGATLRMDTPHWWARGLECIWNGISRGLRYAAGSFLFCETAAFRDTGGFDETLFASEEIELSRRLKRLASARGRRMVILHRHPLVTSARKLRLYGIRAHLRFLWRTVVGFGRTLRRREDCEIWYDGRR